MANKSLRWIPVLLVCMWPAMFLQSYFEGNRLVDSGLLMFFGGAAYATYLHKYHYKNK